MPKIKKYTIGILKHAKIGLAEEVLMDKIRHRGYIPLMINPMDVIYGGGEIHPDVVIVRCKLDSLTDEAFGSYLTYFQYCDLHTIPVINSMEFLLNGQDKYASHMAVDKYVKNNNINCLFNPETYLAYGEQGYVLAQEKLEKWGTLVLKHPQSGRGEGVFYIQNKMMLENILKKHFLNKNTPILVQQTIDKEKNQNGEYQDIRLWVYRSVKTKKPVVFGGYYRNAFDGNFLTNITQGGSISPIQSLDPLLIENACIVLEATGGDVAGIDFARDVHGNYWFEEINIAFETGAASLELLGDGIWDKAVDLALSKI